jgi:hypothetical protein
MLARLRGHEVVHYEGKKTQFFGSFPKNDKQLRRWYLKFVQDLRRKEGGD